jgi:hypothetical protein
LASLIAGYILIERIGRPSETLHLPDADWAKELADVFLHGVLHPVAASGA